MLFRNRSVAWPNHQQPPTLYYHTVALVLSDAKNDQRLEAYIIGKAVDHGIAYPLINQSPLNKTHQHCAFLSLLYDKTLFIRIHWVCALLGAVGPWRRISDGLSTLAIRSLSARLMGFPGTRFLLPVPVQFHLIYGIIDNASEFPVGWRGIEAAACYCREKMFEGRNIVFRCCSGKATIKRVLLLVRLLFETR